MKKFFSWAWSIRLLMLCSTATFIGCRPASTASPKGPGSSEEPRQTEASPSAPSEASPVFAKRAPTADEQILFRALDMQRPDLAAIAAAVTRGDYDAASHEWAIYLKERKGISWGGKNENYLKKYNPKIAEDAAAGIVQGGLVPLAHAFPEGKIDWFYNPTEHEPNQPLNLEWQRQLNRMMFWEEMANAYRATKDERYVKAFAQQLHSWIEQCPVSEDAKKENYKGKSAWRTIEAGIRMGYFWPHAFFSFLPALSDADIVAFSRSVYEHGRYLRFNASSVNWLLMEMNGLSVAGCYFPEFRDAADWRAYAFSRLTSEAKRQLLPDGGQYELSTGYHNDVVINNFTAARNIAINSGREAELPPDYVSAIERAFDWTMYLATPDRNRPKKNDSWSGNILPLMRTASRLYPGRDDFKWLATDGQQGQPPSETSVFLDWSGLVVARSGWEKDANYLMFNVGPLGYGGLMGLGHSHQDKLNVVVWSHGREILFDNGGSSYSQDKWRLWSRTSLSHNCVIVDGLGQFRGDNDVKRDHEHDPERVSQKPIQASWQSNNQFDFATGIYDADYGTPEYTDCFPEVYDPQRGPQKYRIAAQQRSVFFLKPDIYIVADRMMPLDDKKHRYQARWHLLTTNSELNPRTLSVTTTDQNVPNLAVVPLLIPGLEVRPVSAQETPEVLGWDCRKDLRPPNVPATTVLHTRSGAGVQEFLTLLLPLKAGQKNPVVSVKKGPAYVQVEFESKASLRISTSSEGKIAVQEILQDGTAGRSFEPEVVQ